MNSGPRSAPRSFKLLGIGLILLALSTAAAMVMAQPRPDDLRGLATEGKFPGVSTASGATDARGVASAYDFVAERSEALPVVSREVSATSETTETLHPTAGAHHRVPMVTDWSTRHVVFAKPKTAEQAKRLEHNTRYQMQISRRNAPLVRRLAEARANDSSITERFGNRWGRPLPKPTKVDPVHRDWSVNLNGDAATLTPTPTVGDEQFPAKYTFDINAPPDCTNDFVVYNTNTPLLVAFNNLYSGTDPITSDPNGTCFSGDTQLTAPTVMWAYNVNSFSDGKTSTSVTLSLDGTQVAFVETGSGSEGSVLHILKWQAGQGTIASPAAPRNVTGAPTDWKSCGGAYTGCIWNVPFALDTIGHRGSIDVKKAEFSVRPDNYTTLHAATDSNSAPFYDYDNDVLYVGTDSANIHQFTTVFGSYGGTPVESGGYWPVYMNTTANPALTGPVLDSFSGRIFVATSDGFLKYIETSDAWAPDDLCNNSGTAGPYPCLSNNKLSTGNAIPDPPTVDSSLGTVMIFQGNDTNTGSAFAAQASSTSCVCGTDETPGAFQFADFGPFNGGGVVLHSGDFDNNYYNTTGTGDVTGFMYVCAIDPNGANGYDGYGVSLGGNTALRRINFNSDGIVTGADTTDYIPVATDPYDECSPVTEVYNPNVNPPTGQDLMFFSVRAHSVPCLLTGDVYSGTAPAGGCLMSVDVTLADGDPTGAVFPTLSASIPEDGGTSGIVVDNISPDAQASSVYFTPLGWPDDPGNTCTYVGCAVKATQDGLN